MAHERQYCSLFLDGNFFGVEVGQVQEVLRYQEMTRVPLAPPVVCGLINLRGQIVIALDLRRRLGLEEAPTGALPTNVVIRTADGPVSLLVDDIGEVLAPDEAAFEPVPETLKGMARELIRGAYKLPERLLLVLETDRLAQTPAFP
jgi:purine-binding chemotaxis protein CheW